MVRRLCKILCRIGIHDLWPEYKPIKGTPTAKYIMKCKRCKFEIGG